MFLLTFKNSRRYEIIQIHNIYHSQAEKLLQTNVQTLPYFSCDEKFSENHSSKEFSALTSYSAKTNPLCTEK